MRTPVPLPRGTAWIALAGVSAGGAYVSYLHGYSVCMALGTGRYAAAITPVLADLVILGESAALLEVSRRRPVQWPWWDIAALAVAILMTLAMNVSAAHPDRLPLWLVDAWPPVAFGLALHCLIGMSRRGRVAPSPQPDPGPCIHDLPESASKDRRIVAAFLHARDCLHGKPSFRAIGRELDAHHATVARVVRSHLAASPEPPAGADLPSPRATAPAGSSLALSNGSHDG